MHFVLLSTIRADHRRRRAGVATQGVGATEVGPWALNGELLENTQLFWDVAESRRYVLGAAYARTVKGPIQRRDSSYSEGRGLCSVSRSTSSPAANCKSRRWALGAALR